MKRGNGSRQDSSNEQNGGNEQNRKKETRMGHLTTRDAYRNLSDRINWFTQGAPTSETLYKILEVLYTEKEAKWVALLPVRPFTVKKAAKIWQTSVSYTHLTLPTTERV